MRISTCVCLAFLLRLAAISPALAQGNNSNPGVLPPNSSPHGHTYGEWNALWWRWFISLPLDNNPATGADCSTGQVGSVWFLIGLPGPTTINCTVPPGKTLVLPIINIECSNLEPPPFFGATPADRAACAAAITNTAVNLSATIDGVPVHNLTSYRSPSPNFTFAAPPNNVLGVPGGAGESVADGFYLVLVPFSPGTHVIHIAGAFLNPAFAIDTTINLTVRH